MDWEKEREKEREREEEVRGWMERVRLLNSGGMSFTNRSKSFQKALKRDLLDIIITKKPPPGRYL